METLFELNNELEGYLLELKSYQMNTFILNEEINKTLSKIEEVQNKIKILEEKQNG